MKRLAFVLSFSWMASWAAAPAPSPAHAPVAQARPTPRAADAEYWRRRAETEEADKRKTRRYYLSLSPFSVLPGDATPYQDVVLTANVLVQGLEPGVCPDPAHVSVARQEQTFRLSFPLTPCANPYAFNAPPVELDVGRLQPGSYLFELDVPNDLGLNPVKSQRITIRPVATDDEALMIAVIESAKDVEQWLARRTFSQDRLDTALNLACGFSRGRNGDNPATVHALLAAGARPNAAIHQAAQAAPRCLAALIAAHADVNVDIAGEPGSLLSYTDEGMRVRFKVGAEGPPLLYAVRARNPETTRLLLDAGADPNRSFAFGKSPYAESYLPVMGDDEKALAIRHLMEARGGVRTPAQRAMAAAQRTEDAVKGGGIVTVCLLSALFGGGCH